ncbi:MAG: ABC transporter substrate-binding protein [Ancalomicrobiaceae bacterium]|nr:ABC transporter substrate-binding protein [Ancalomicrobiaceae bacterium]
MKFALMLSVSVAAVATFTGVAAAAPLDDLIAAAKKEGELTVITLPHDWCGYGEVIDAFKKKYGLKINELNPEGSSADEIEAVKANKGNKGPQAPDVLDIGLSFGPSAKAEGLIQPYKVSTWNDIGADVKDADGFWYGDYYGVMSFAVNKDIIKTTPTDWADLLKPEYKGAVSLPGDPRGANEAIQVVYAAGLSRTANSTDAAKNGAEGLKFFAELNKEGNFVPVTGKKAQLAQGTTPIIIRWTFNNLDHRDSLKGNPPVDVVIPKTGVVAGVYVQAISAYAPHPNAAKLWEEFLYSDEGQTMWLAGYCNPIRFNAMSKAGKIPADLLKKLPPAEDFAKAVFPTLAQQAAAKDVIAKQWDTVVGAVVK